jgi:5-methylcytosine-specific restriction protein A
MSYIVKTAPAASDLGSILNCKVRSLYGGGDAAPDDDVFVWFSETQGGDGLSYKGKVIAASHGGGYADLSIELIQKAEIGMKNIELASGEKQEVGTGMYGLYTKIMDHAHNKIAALNDAENALLASHFSSTVYKHAPTPSTTQKTAEGEFEGAPFEIGKIYNRRKDIHVPFGGQERGGITTPVKSRFVFLFTGEQGENYGYQDGLRQDGVFEYTGEGQTGHMTFVRGNRAIRDHAADGKELLLFQAQKSKGQYRFLGSFVSQGYEIRQALDRSQSMRDIIVFHLVQLDVAKDEPSIDDDSSEGLDELRTAAYAATAPGLQTATAAAKTVYSRSAAVRRYVLARANGVCECCMVPAPFVRANGTPYLEPHHTRRLAESGTDHPRCVSFICYSF